MVVVPSGNAGNYGISGIGFGQATTRADIQTVLPVPMRIAPTATLSRSMQLSDSGTATAVTSISTDTSGSTSSVANTLVYTASGLTSLRPYRLENANNTTARIIFNADY